jgi:hypothetical protein
MGDRGWGIGHSLESLLLSGLNDHRTYATGTQGFWYKSQGSRVNNQGFLDF